MRAHISRWTLGAALSIAVTVGGTMVAAMPAHGQSITGLGQAGQQFSGCHFPSLDDGMCGGNSHDGGGTGWQLSILSIEPAVGLVPSPCRRRGGNE